MKKMNFCMSALFAACISVMGFSSCSSDDDVKTNPTEKSNISPNGIVLLSVPNEVVAGDTVEISFRINPSTATITKENLSLDCLASNVFDVEISDEENLYLGNSTSTDDDTEAETRAMSYVQSSESFSIVSLRNDSIDGKALDGQYVIRVAAQSARNIIDESKWALVCSATDANKDTANVSSEVFAMTQIPQPKNGVFAWSPQALNYKVGTIKRDVDMLYYMDSTAVNGTRWYTTPRTYKNKITGEVRTYDYAKYVKQAKAMLMQDSTVLTTTDKEVTDKALMNTENSHIYSAVPDTKSEPFATFENDNTQNFVTFTNVLSLTDKYGHVSVWAQPMNYVLTNTLYVEIAVPDPVVAGDYSASNIKEYLLSKYGIDLDVSDRYPYKAYRSGAGLKSHGLGAKPMSRQMTNRFVYDDLYVNYITETLTVEKLFSHICNFCKLYGLSENDIFLQMIQKFKTPE